MRPVFFLDSDSVDSSAKRVSKRMGIPELLWLVVSGRMLTGEDGKEKIKTGKATTSKAGSNKERSVRLGNLRDHRYRLWEVVGPAL